MSLKQLLQSQPFSITPLYHASLITTRDLDDIIAMLENPKVTKFLFFAPAPEAVYREFFSPIIEQTQQAIELEQWPEHPTVIIRDQQGHFMGMAGLTQVSMLEGNYEVGYQLPEHAWNKGIATAACQLMTQLAFEQLNAHKVCADCYASNIGSVRALEKNNYQLEGRQSDYYQHDGEFDDRVLFGLSLKQYQQQPIDIVI